MSPEIPPSPANALGTIHYIDTLAAKINTELKSLSLEERKAITDNIEEEIGTPLREIQKFLEDLLPNIVGRKIEDGQLSKEALNRDLESFDWKTIIPSQSARTRFLNTCKRYSLQHAGDLVALNKEGNRLVIRKGADGVSLGFGKESEKLLKKVLGLPFERDLNPSELLNIKTFKKQH